MATTTTTASVMPASTHQTNLYSKHNNASQTSTASSALSPSELGVALARVLNSCLVQPNPAAKNPFLLFCSEAPISLEDFGARLGRYFACSPVCFEVAAVYLGRVQATHPQLFEPLGVYKLMLVALTVAVKFCEDQCCPQLHYAKCGGIEAWELNSLESLFFIELLKMNAHVSETELRVASILLENACGRAHVAGATPLVARVAAETPRSQALVVPQSQQKPNHSSF